VLIRTPYEHRLTANLPPRKAAPAGGIQLKFGNTKTNSDNQVVLTGATKDSLTNMGSYSYTHS
jgi:hypothetical protein